MRATLVLPPNREIDFDCACVCVACVRASERSCVREMIPLWLGSGGEICGYPSVPPGGGPDQKLELFEFRPMIRDRVELLNVPVWWSRCVVCVSCVFRGGVRCWMAVLDPPVSLCQRVLDPPVSLCQRVSGESFVSQSESE